MNAVSPLDEVLLGARFLRGLPAFLRHPISLDYARAALRERLERREADFLALVYRAVYLNRDSPYSWLLRYAGCEYSDLVKLIRSDGLEGALRVLLRKGVYLTVEEFKGRRAIVRGGQRLAVEPGQLRNLIAASPVPACTGGSRGVGTAVPMSFAHIRDRAVDTLIGLDARGGAGWSKAHWHVPGGGVIARLLEFSSFGPPVARWFSQVHPAAPGLHPRYRWSARVLRWGSVIGGVPLPAPEFVPLDDPLPIIRWMTETLRGGSTPHLFTFVSSAVRLSQAAQAVGADLGGAELTVTGEPFTRARLASIRSSGAQVSPRYAVTECGAVGFGCLAPMAVDDVHVLGDLHAVIQPGPGQAATGTPATGLFLTSLRPTAPYLLLNVSMGDQAELVDRVCGCSLERVGWTSHLHTIRSFEKLTAGGMTFFDGDVIRVLEDILPARFGGGPTDYQLLEQETSDGRPHVRLLVNPAIGPIEARSVADCFLEAVGAGPGPQAVMAQVWRDAGLLSVERSVPRTTPAGKILHLSTEQRPIVVRGRR